MNPMPPPMLPKTPPPGAGAVSASALLGDRRVLLIEHGGEYYKLRLTCNGKLILTK